MVVRQQSIENIIPNQYISLISPQELTFSLTLNTQGLHNKMHVVLYRYEPTPTPTPTLNLNAPHTSFLINKNTNTLQGFVRLLPEYHEKEIQVSKQDAETAMRNFLISYAPDLLDNFKLNWVDKHDEIILINNQKIKIAGMKVKCRDLNTGLYFWTIIAPDHSVMIFERDVEWDFLRAGRQTQKWLHDDWLKKEL